MSSPSALEFVVLGTGTSSAPPAIKCLTDAQTGCLSCRQTLLPPSDPAYAAGQQNIRRNTSGVLRIPGKDGGREKTLLIDVSPRWGWRSARRTNQPVQVAGARRRLTGVSGWV